MSHKVIFILGINCRETRNIVRQWMLVATVNLSFLMVIIYGIKLLNNEDRQKAKKLKTKLSIFLGITALSGLLIIQIGNDSRIQLDVYYKNCSEARVYGRTPIYRGEPGYRNALDRDQDGIACE